MMAVRMPKNGKGYWSVSTDNSEYYSQPLGVFYGYVDDIAFDLAHRAHGFWCEPRLFFAKRQEDDTDIVSTVRSKNKGQYKEINICIEPYSFDLPKLSQMQKFFTGRPVTVEGTNYYNTFKLIRNIKKTGKRK